MFPTECLSSIVSLIISTAHVLFKGSKTLRGSELVPCHKMASIKISLFDEQIIGVKPIIN